MEFGEIRKSWKRVVEEQNAALIAKREAKVKADAARELLPKVVTQAEMIIDHVGDTSTDESSSLKKMRQSVPIPLGHLGHIDADGRSHGFAVISVVNDVVLQEVTQKKFLRTSVSYVEEIGPASLIEVSYYAGDEQSANTMVIDRQYWSVPVAGSEDNGDLGQTLQHLQFLAAISNVPVQTD